jgi:hypothetical protein
VLDHRLDDWSCRETKQRCPIGAVLNRKDVDRSLSRCNAPDDVKEGVRVAVSVHAYDGLHHATGKYLCARCPRRYTRSRSYHYPFELQQLGDVIDLTDRADRLAARRSLLALGFSPSLLYAGICARCLLDVVKTIRRALSATFEVLQLQADL